MTFSNGRGQHSKPMRALRSLVIVFASTLIRCSLVYGGFLRQRGK